MHTELLPQFALDLRRRGLSEGTITLRLYYLAALGDWLAPRSLLQAEPQQLENFLDSRSLQPRTRRAWRSHLRSFYRWAVKQGLLAANPADDLITPRVPKLVARPISGAHLQRALGSAGPLMRSWLSLCAYAGLRCKEVAGFVPDDLEGQPPSVVVRDGKAGNQRVIPGHPLLLAALGECCRWDVDPSTVSRSVANYMRGIGVPATAHQLRAWFATALYNDTRDLRLVQEMMGHADIRTTAGYVSLAPNGAEAVKNLRV